MKGGQRSLWLAVAAVVLTGVAVGLVYPTQLCPGCFGFTVEETPKSRAGRVDPNSADMPCRRCDGRGCVSLLNQWFGHGGRN